jgi:hypothetical protein
MLRGGFWRGWILLSEGFFVCLGRLGFGYVMWRRGSGCFWMDGVVKWGGGGGGYRYDY